MLMKYRKFPLYGAPYSFVGGIGKQLLAVIIKSYAGLYVLGLFSVAMQPSTYLCHSSPVRLDQYFTKEYVPI